MSYANAVRDVMESVVDTSGPNGNNNKNTTSGSISDWITYTNRDWYNQNGVVFENVTVTRAIDDIPAGQTFPAVTLWYGSQLDAGGKTYVFQAGAWVAR